MIVLSIIRDGGGRILRKAITWSLRLFLSSPLPLISLSLPLLLALHPVVELSLRARLSPDLFHLLAESVVRYCAYFALF